MKQTGNANYQYMGIFTALGVGIGAAIGAATNNMSLWVAAGVGIGVVIGAALTAANRSKQQ